MITETADISDAIDRAAQVWPESRDERADLIRHILVAWRDGIERAAEQGRSERAQAVDSVAGSLSGLWPTNWRERRDLEWPE